MKITLIRLCFSILGFGGLVWLTGYTIIQTEFWAMLCFVLLICLGCGGEKNVR